MKNILLSLLVVVSLVGSANMLAMQTGDAGKVQDLITKGKATEQTLAAFAKVSGKLKDKLGVTDADYKAWLAQKGGASVTTATGGEAVTTATGGEAPKGGQATETGVYKRPEQIEALYKRLADAKTVEELDTLEQSVKGYMMERMTPDMESDYKNLLADIAIQKNAREGEKAVKGLSPFAGGKTEPSTTAKTEPAPEAPTLTEAQVDNAILAIAKNKTKAKAMEYLNSIIELADNIKKADYW